MHQPAPHDTGHTRSATIGATTGDGGLGRTGHGTAPLNAAVGSNGRRGRSGRSPAGPRARAGAVAWCAGAAAVLTAHQAALWALHQAGWAPWPAYVLAPTRPFGVPAVASAAFWGGVWWVTLDPVVRRARTARGAYGRAAGLGAVLPNAVGVLLAAAGHRFPVAAEVGAGRTLVSAVAVNALWAVTAAALARAARRGRRPTPPAAARPGRAAA